MYTYTYISISTYDENHEFTQVLHFLSNTTDSILVFPAFIFVTPFSMRSLAPIILNIDYVINLHVCSQSPIVAVSLSLHGHTPHLSWPQNPYSMYIISSTCSGPYSSCLASLLQENPPYPAQAMKSHTVPSLHWEAFLLLPSSSNTLDSDTSMYGLPPHLTWASKYLHQIAILHGSLSIPCYLLGPWELTQGVIPP